MEAAQILPSTRMCGHPRHGGSGVAQGPYLHRCLRMVQSHKERVSPGVYAAGPEGHQSDTPKPKAIRTMSHSESTPWWMQDFLGIRESGYQGNRTSLLLEIIGSAFGVGRHGPRGYNGHHYIYMATRLQRYFPFPAVSLSRGFPASVFGIPVGVIKTV